MGILERFRPKSDQAQVTEVFGPRSIEEVNRVRRDLIREFRRDPWLQPLVSAISASDRGDLFEGGLGQEPEEPQPLPLVDPIFRIVAQAASILSKEEEEKKPQDLRFLKGTFERRKAREAEYQKRHANWQEEFNKRRKAYQTLMQAVSYLQEVKRLKDKASVSPILLDTPGRVETRVAMPFRFNQFLQEIGHDVQVAMPVLEERYQNSRELLSLGKKGMSQIHMVFTDHEQEKGSASLTFRWLGARQVINFIEARPTILNDQDELIDSIPISSGMTVRVPIKTTAGKVFPKIAAREATLEQIAFEIALRVAEENPGIYIPANSIREGFVKALDDDGFAVREIRDLLLTTTENEEKADDANTHTGQMQLKFAVLHLLDPTEETAERIPFIFDLMSTGLGSNVALLRHLIYALALPEQQWKEFKRAYGNYRSLPPELIGELSAAESSDALRKKSIGAATEYGSVLLPTSRGERSMHLYSRVTVTMLLDLVTHPRFLEGIFEHIPDTDEAIYMLASTIGQLPGAKLDLVNKDLERSLEAHKVVAEYLEKNKDLLAGIEAEDLRQRLGVPEQQLKINQGARKELPQSQRVASD